MPPADHLIERAAALLQNAPSRPAPVPDEASSDLPPLPEGGPIPLPVSGAAPWATLPARESGSATPVQTSVATPDLTKRSDAGQPTIISVDTLQAAGMAVARGGRTRVSEEYRIVLGRVLRAMRQDSGAVVPGKAGSTGLQNLVMVTSARPGEGKSFTALNLAGSIAQHSADKVLLVDIDAKPKPLTSQLQEDGRPGFYDLVVDPMLRPEAVVRSTGITNLLFLPVGTRINDLDGASALHSISTTLARLARQYSKHVVLLDAPPCLSTSDPHTLAPLVGQVVMVIEAERTQRAEVEAALDLVRICPNITVLLNKVRLTSRHTFGSYDYYGAYR